MDRKNIELLSGMKILYKIQNEIISPLDWVDENKQKVKYFLEKNGILFIHGFNNVEENDFGTMLTQLFDEELIDYKYRSMPRTELKNKVYTASEYHHKGWIPQHNENSYSNVWPPRIGFYVK